MKIHKQGFFLIVRIKMSFSVLFYFPFFSQKLYTDAHTLTHKRIHVRTRQSSCPVSHAVSSHPQENGKQSSVTSSLTYSLIPSILWGWMMITGKPTEAAQINTPQAVTKACPPHPKHSFPCKIRFQSNPRTTYKQ